MADKVHTSCRFSLNVRQPCDGRTIVLHSLTRLSQDVLADLEDCRKGGCALVVQASWLVVCFLAFLQQPCNQAQCHFTVSGGSLATLAGEIRECKFLCETYKHLTCLAAALRALQQYCVLKRTHKSRKANEYVKNLVIHHCGNLATL